VTEVLAYGSAVIVEPISPRSGEHAAEGAGPWTGGGTNR